MTYCIAPTGRWLPLTIHPSIVFVWCPEITTVYRAVQLNRMGKIFVVDDDVDIGIVMKYWLTSKGHAVAYFDSDATLMERIVESPPDIIFLDVNLAGKDGRDICKEIKAVAPIVVIILFSANPSVLLNFKDCRADDAFSKPFTFSLLQEKINKFMPAVYQEPD